MAVQIGTNISVQAFGFQSDDDGKRLVFPRVESHDLAGRAGALQYGAADVLLDKMVGRLDVTRWAAEAASLGGVWLRDDAGRVNLAIDRAEMPNGLVLVRAAKGVEILSPHVTLSEVKLTVLNPAPAAPERAPESESAPPAAPPVEPPHLSQERLRFLDSLAGRIDVTVKVTLDLPVLGVRALDQRLDVRIQDGSIDYRSLEEQLDWLGGKFLDIKHADDNLMITWRVPIFGSKHELISWALDTEAATVGAFGRVPVRALADYHLASSDKIDDDKKKKKTDDTGGLLRAFTLDAIDIALSLLAPRNLEVGGGMIAFGGDGQPGMVDLEVTGRVSNHGAGALHGAIGSLDTTIKDLKLGGVVVSADRLSIDGIDALEVTFDGFRPTEATMVIHRVTATNLIMKIGSGA